MATTTTRTPTQSRCDENVKLASVTDGAPMNVRSGKSTFSTVSIASDTQPMMIALMMRPK